MSKKNRRALAIVAVVSALTLALPAPSQAADLWDWQPAKVAAQVWSWLEGLGLIPQPEKPSGGLQKEGSMVEPDGRTTHGSSSTTTPASTNGDEGSMVDPDGRK